MRESVLFFIASVFIVFVSQSLISQEFVSLTSTDGLSSNSIKTIAQDSTGLIWIGTEKGLNCYNGYDIKTYLHNPADSNSIIDNVIVKLLVTSNDELVIATHAGFSIYNKDLDNFTNYKIKKESFGTNMESYINAIAEDRNNNLWLASATGVYKFNMQERVVKEHFVYSILFVLTDDITTKLNMSGVPDNIIGKLYSINNRFFYNETPLSDKLLKILGEIDYEKYAQTIIDIVLQNENSFFFTSSISSLVIDNEDRIWLGLSNGHIVQSHTNSKDYKLAYFNKESDIESNIFSMYYENDQLWFSTIEKGYLFDVKKWKLQVSNNKVLESIFNKRDVIFAKNKANEIWLGTSRGLYLYDIKQKSAIEYKSSLTDVTSISSDLITVVFVDKQNNVWVGTNDGGISKTINTKQFKKYSRKTLNKENVIDNRITSIYVDRNNSIWGGHYTGGIDLFNTNGILESSFEYSEKNNSGIAKGTIMSIVEDKDGVIWVASYLGGFQKYNRDSKSFTDFELLDFASKPFHPFQIVCDGSNNLWVNSLGYGLFKISADRSEIYSFTTEDTTFNSGLPSSWISFLYITNEERIIFYADGRLYELDEVERSFSRIFTNEHDFDYDVKLAYEDVDDNFYLGTTGGLFIVKVDGKLTSAYKDKPLLENYTIMSILEDEQGNLWVSTDYGLFRIKLNPKKYLESGEVEINQYLIGDGLPSNSFMTKAKYKAQDGKMFFGTEKGIISFYPDSIKENQIIPNVILTDFKLFNKSVTPGEDSYLKKHISQTKTLTLPHNQNFISFNFAAINYINSPANEYAYQMIGIDEDWIFAANKREANYTSLSHGTYTFRVKASNNDGVWNDEGVQVKVTIKPPFWKTKLALFIYFIIFFILLLVFAYIIRYQEKFKTEMKLERMNVEKDNELNKMKLRFFTNISHEFRTPLTLILGPIENLIEEGKGNADQIQFIHRNTKKLLSLIDQIMDIRKLSSGKMKLDRKFCEIVEFTGQLVSNFEFQSQKKGIKLNYLKTIDNLSVEVDTDKYETIITNLISNAIKHTSDGGEILVSINLGKLSENNFSVSVKDTGIGIPENEIENVFERFYQSSLKSKGGSGIGLTLVKELTEMHGGKVELISEEGVGSEFVVYLPISDKELNTEVIKEERDEELVEKRTIESEQMTEEHINLSEDELFDQHFADLDSALPLILVVEDNDEVRNYTISELKNDYRIIDAANGKIGLELANEKYPDIIISDIMMPEMDGLEMCKALKDDEKTSHIPIIILTAYNNENTNVAGYETGAESFLVKPFSPKVLKTRIKNILKNREMLKDKFSNILYSAPTNKSVNAIDEQFIRKAIVIVEANLVEETFSIDFLCKEMGYSRTALYSKIKALTDQSISEFIKLIRLKKSIELFQNGQNSINEVAFMVGFKTHSHFSRCFSEEFNMSPTDYLAQLNKDEGK